MDHLFLEGLEIPCRVGCTEPERQTLQSLRCDVKLFCASLQEAGRADDLERSVDYRMATDMIAAVQDKEFLLIERVAEVLADLALAAPLVHSVQVTVRKRPPVQGLDRAGVTITRRKA